MGRDVNVASGWGLGRGWGGGQRRCRRAALPQVCTFAGRQGGRAAGRQGGSVELARLQAAAAARGDLADLAVEVRVGHAVNAHLVFELFVRQHLYVYICIYAYMHICMCMCMYMYEVGTYCVR